MKLFNKRKWGKWNHVMYIESFRAGNQTYQLLGRECQNTGLTQYNKVKISATVHNLSAMLTSKAQTL